MCFLGVHILFCPVIHFSSPLISHSSSSSFYPIEGKEIGFTCNNFSTFPFSPVTLHSLDPAYFLLLLYLISPPSSFPHVWYKTMELPVALCSRGVPILSSRVPSFTCHPHPPRSSFFLSPSYLINGMGVNCFFSLFRLSFSLPIKF